ncbi:hypothetical protein EDB85DRAFT_2158024 [Lactarius pseudohatsudake]|nr:hypothetical protein EDB85DRAFT_2158024 [Lactarius pseudohatsudake]
MDCYVHETLMWIVLCHGTYFSSTRTYTALQLTLRSAKQLTLPPLCWRLYEQVTSVNVMSCQISSRTLFNVPGQSELSSGSHIALVKTVIDEMLLEHDAMFAKLRADLHPGLLSRLIAFNWAHRSKQAILEALAVVGDATTAHARRLVMHGESVYHDLRFLESISLEVSGLLAVQGAAVKREKINSKMLTFFGGHRGALRILEGRGADLHCINNLWREARDSLSLSIHAFNGVRSDLTALSEHQTGPKTARLHVPVDKQDSNFKGWVGRIEARRVLTPAQMHSR